MLGFEFETNKEPYAVFNMQQALGVFVFTIIESFLKNRASYMIYTFAVGIIGACCAFCTFFFDYRDFNHKSKGKMTIEKIKAHSLNKTDLDFSQTSSELLIKNNSPATAKRVPEEGADGFDFVEN